MDQKVKRARSWDWLADVLLVIILVIAAAFRFTGVNWDGSQHPHPDERFLTMVETAITPVTGCRDTTLAVVDCPLSKRVWVSPSQYFDTPTSPLNPQNRGYGFFVYGTLPLFLVRYTAEIGQGLSPAISNFANWLNTISITWHLKTPLGAGVARLAFGMRDWTGYDGVDLVGRGLSALADLGTIFLLYCIVTRVYGRRIALLSAAFSAVVVMQIQQSHFFTVDNFVNFFMFLALYFAVRIAFDDGPHFSSPKVDVEVEGEVDEDGKPVPAAEPVAVILKAFFRDRFFWLSLAFGVALGMAVASKINAAVLALMLPFAFLVWYFRQEKARRSGMRSIEWVVILFLVLGALASVITFRIFQPYAFTGPGFFGFKPSPDWITSISSQRAQAGGMADVPWALQWARRNHLYSFKNLTLWGLGLPLGILAWAGFLWMAWHILKGEWKTHLFLWGWTAFYFLWQSLQFNPTMRYQLPVYPLMCMLAAWLVFTLWDYRGRAVDAGGRFRRWGLRVLPVAGLGLGLLVLAATTAWALAFTGIYTRTETRLAASRWIYQHVPGPINLEYQALDGSSYTQPLPFAMGTAVLPQAPYQTAFTAPVNGYLNEIVLPHVSDYVLRVTMWQNVLDASPMASGYLMVTPGKASQADSQFLVWNQAPNLFAQQMYLLRFETLDPELALDLCGILKLTITTNAGAPYEQDVDSSGPCIMNPGQPYQLQFAALGDGFLDHMHFTRVENVSSPESQTLHLILSTSPDPQSTQVLAQSSAQVASNPPDDPRGDSVTFVLDQPLALVRDQAYYLRIETSGGGLSFTGAAPANETDFDLGLPFPVDGYNGFGGLYVGGLNLQVYYDDNANKLERFTTTLDQSDYIFIPSNHQFSQIVRIPERFPLTTAYYRALIGCPPEKDIIWCYNVAEPGMFKGSLGFDLVQTFESYPTLGPLRINDQSAEEAFTIYDHVKVFVFKKSPDYDPVKVASILGAVDLSHVVHLLPGQAASYKDLMLPADRLAVQQAGGTWSNLFNWESVQNKYSGLGILFWYLFIFLVGVITYPLVRAAFPGLADRGYPLARVVGLLLWAWLSWMAGSLGLTYSRLVIGLALGFMAILGACLAWRQRLELKVEFRQRWKFFLLVEGLFLVFFLLDLGIRLGNPDLWHPYKGGERPMDFSYFNAILKSTTFPPYDPWFAGGYINYYYYGYVIVGTPVKLLGIVPSIAYNFILPTLFACLAASAFSVGYNLLHSNGNAEPWSWIKERWSVWTGFLASTAMLLLGNLGTVRMFYQGFQRIAAPGGVVENANIFQRIFWMAKGFILALGGASLPFVRGDFYWFPSRALPDASGSPITEFPLFTFLYSDLHAHMIAYMITVLVIAWVLSVLKAKAVWSSWVNAVIGFFVGGLAIGALKPTNTWDFYTYLVLALIVLFYATLRKPALGYFPSVLAAFPDWFKRILAALTGGVVLAALSLLLYQPFSHWFSLGVYVGVEAWKGSRSNLSSYLVHWGVFLFFIVTWITWETRNWMAETPASSLRKLRPYLELILAILSLIVLVLIGQQAWVMSATQTPPWKGVTILWLALPLAVWAAVLILRPGQPDIKRLVLFMVGTSLLLTMVVELFVIKGDIGRMNTVFKFYLQAWTMLGISATAAVGWLVPEMRKWLPGWRNAWQVFAGLLVTGAVLFLLIGGMDKIRDRWWPAAPHTLDSMAYMPYADYSDFGVTMKLDEDYRAIRWMQANVQGSPVIVEANCVEYHWCSRYTIYTGLPGVVGWNWHQRQQRALMSDQVWNRVNEIGVFYGTTDMNVAKDFIQKYNIRYIVVGQLERAAYPADGIAKFAQNAGITWKEVYQDGQTSIYEVLP